MNLIAILTILHAKQTSESRYSGKVFLSAILLVFVLIACVVFMSYGIHGTAFSKFDEATTQLHSSKSLNNKSTVGVVKGIACSPASSCAVVGETLVHVGDKIHNIVVVGIQSDAVEFAKNGVTWRQTVLESPNAAWTAPACKTKNN
jgi:hypothetical protein